MWLIDYVLDYVFGAGQILGMSVILAGCSYVITDQANRGNASWQVTITFLIVFFFPAIYFWEWVTWRAN